MTEKEKLKLFTMLAGITGLLINSGLPENQKKILIKANSVAWDNHVIGESEKFYQQAKYWETKLPTIS